MADSQLTVSEQNHLIKMYNKFEKAKGTCIEALEPLDPLVVIIETLTAEQVFSMLGDEPRKKPLSTSELSMIIVDYAKSLISQEQLAQTSQAELSLYGDLLQSNQSANTSAGDPPKTYTALPLTHQIINKKEEQVDQLENDDYAYCQQMVYSEEEYFRRYPNLPRGPCPRKLYIATLKQSYLNSIYLVDPSAYPDKWEELKKRDPIQAWNSLNQTIIRYTNKRWANQGIDIKGGETAMDLYNIQDVKASIIETIDNHLKTSHKDEKKTQTGVDPTAATNVM